RPRGDPPLPCTPFFRSARATRSSTSRRWMAARIMRMDSGRAESLLRMADFMSSMMRVFRSMGTASGRARVARRDGRESVEAAALHVLAGDAFLLAFYRGRGLAFPDRGGFLVVFATAALGEDAGLFAGTTETAEDEVERLILLDAD